MSKKKTPEERMAICKKCPHLNKWKVCDICKCFMPLKTKIRWAECPEEVPRWTQEYIMALTAKQKKLPKALQQAILKKMKKKGKKKKGGKKKRSRG